MLPSTVASYSLLEKFMTRGKYFFGPHGFTVGQVLAQVRAWDRVGTRHRSSNPAPPWINAIISSSQCQRGCHGSSNARLSLCKYQFYNLFWSLEHAPWFLENLQCTSSWFLYLVTPVLPQPSCFTLPWDLATSLTPTRNFPASDIIFWRLYYRFSKTNRRGHLVGYKIFFHPLLILPSPSVPPYLMPHLLSPTNKPILWVDASPCLFEEFSPYTGPWSSASIPSRRLKKILLRKTNV